MSNHLLYLVGPPASGKSSVFRELTRECGSRQEKKPFLHTTWTAPTGQEIVELGGRRPEFSGTDMLAMNAVTAVEQWLEATPPPLLIGEGDRLANARFLDGAVERGYQVWLFHLVTPALKLSDRRWERDLDGQGQNPQWVRGRETAIRNLLTGREHYDLDGDRNPSWVVEEMLTIATPFRDALRAAVPHA